MSFLVIIPARYSSTRLPGKPLIEIAKRPMIWHVCQRALESEAIRVVVATDDQRIVDIVSGFGIECFMTRTDHPTGTDRLAEVAQKLRLAPETIVVNVQGDEPLLPSASVNQVAKVLEDHPDASVATLCEPIRSSVDVTNPNKVKVVMSESGRALYFSRASIPGHPTALIGMHFRHIGLYAYRAKFLSDFTLWKPTNLERFEKLEQIRALSYDRVIQVEVTEETIPHGVDTEADLKAVRRLLDS